MSPRTIWRARGSRLRRRGVRARGTGSSLRTLMRNRFQSYDSTFTRYRTDALTLHRDGAETTIKSQRGVRVFDDHNGVYYDSANPTGGVIVPDTHTRIKIAKEGEDGSWVVLRVGPSGK